MDWRQPIDALDFDNHLVVHDQIGTMLGEQFSLGVEGDSELSLERQPPRFEFHTQCRLIHGLEKTWSQVCVDLDRAANYSIGSGCVSVHMGSALPRLRGS